MYSAQLMSFMVFPLWVKFAVVCAPGYRSAVFPAGGPEPSLGSGPSGVPRLPGHPASIDRQNYAMNEIRGSGR